jgi:hypothetical protein
MKEADPHGVVVDVVVRHQDVVGDRDLEADHAVVHLVADDAHVVGGRHPHRRVQRAVGDVAFDQAVRGDGRVDPVLEIPGGFVADHLEVPHEAGLDPVAREVLHRETANLEALELVGAIADSDLRPAALGRRVDARQLSAERNEPDLAGLAAAPIRHADQAEAVGGDAEPEPVVPGFPIHARPHEDGVAGRRRVDRSLDGLARSDAMDGRMGDGGARDCDDSEQRTETARIHLWTSSLDRWREGLTTGG